MKQYRWIPMKTLINMTMTKAYVSCSFFRPSVHKRAVIRCLTLLFPTQPSPYQIGHTNRRICVLFSNIDRIVSNVWENPLLLTRTKYLRGPTGGEDLRKPFIWTLNSVVDQAKCSRESLLKRKTTAEATSRLVYSIRSKEACSITILMLKRCRVRRVHIQSLRS